MSVTAHLVSDFRDELLELKRTNTHNEILEWLEEEHDISISLSTLGVVFRRIYEDEIEDNEESIGFNESSFSTMTLTGKFDEDIAAYQKKEEVKYWKTLYQNNIKSETIWQRLENTLREVVTPHKPVKVHYSKPNSNGTSKSTVTQSAISPLSDLHIGEVVDLGQMGGFNEYNLDIISKRLYGWAETVKDLTTRRNINRLYVPMLGDMVSGDIHLELEKTNEDNLVGQMARGASLVSQAIMFLSQYYEEIIIPCVVGNHGRMTMKPPMKDKYVGFDYLMYQTIAFYCKDQDNIKFVIPESYYTIMEVEKERILMMHGDSISGAGSPQAIMRGVTALRSALQSGFDSVMMGHFHRVDEIDIGTGSIFICGTTKGGDEFAMQRLNVIGKPKQIITYWDSVQGFVGKDIIHLDVFDNATHKFVDSLSEVWAGNGYDNRFTREVIHSSAGS